MGLLDELNDPSNFTGQGNRFRCSVCELVKELPEKEAEVLKKRLLDTKVGHSNISDVLIRNGFMIGRGAIARHRKGNHAL